jgi:hypothetical protein
MQIVQHSGNVHTESSAAALTRLAKRPATALLAEDYYLVLELRQELHSERSDLNSPDSRP